MSKKRRRAKGEGSIYQLSNGSWRASLSFMKPDGTRGRKARTVQNQSSAVIALEEMKRDSGLFVESPTKLTVGKYLLDWLETVAKIDKAENTIVSYGFSIRTHLAPALGRILLSRLTSADVQRAFSAMSEAETGSRTRELAFVVLNSSMNHAVKMGMILTNPCARVSKPKSDRKDIVPFTIAESKLLIAKTRGTLNHAPIVLALMCGLRQGEIFGIHFDRLDMDSGKLRIDQQVQEICGKISVGKPKTKTSVRNIDLPIAVVNALREHRKLLLKYGHAASQILFPASEGGYIRKGNFRTRVWNPLLKKIGLKQRGFHHTRHTYATIALGAGVPVPVVSKILGHSKPSITLDIYAHVLERHTSDATKAIDSLFGSSGYSLATPSRRKSS